MPQHSARGSPELGYGASRLTPAGLTGHPLMQTSGERQASPAAESFRFDATLMTSVREFIRRVHDLLTWQEV